MSNPDSHHTDDHAHDNDHGHADLVADPIPESSLQDKVLNGLVLPIALFGLLFMVWSWTHINLPDVPHEGGQATEQELAPPASAPGQ